MIEGANKGKQYGENVRARYLIRHSEESFEASSEARICFSSICPFLCCAKSIMRMIKLPDTENQNYVSRKIRFCFAISIALFLFSISISQGQSKKKQIEILEGRLDSLREVATREEKLKGESQQREKELEGRITKLEAKNSFQEKKAASRFDSLRVLLANEQTIKLSQIQKEKELQTKIAELESKLADLNQKSIDLENQLNNQISASSQIKNTLKATEEKLLSSEGKIQVAEKEYARQLRLRDEEFRRFRIASRLQTDSLEDVFSKLLKTKSDSLLSLVSSEKKSKNSAEGSKNANKEKNPAKSGKPASVASVTIGNQVWMKKNLDTDRYANGDLIPQASYNEEWHDEINNEKGAWCYYNNNPTNGAKYGRLYNWYAVSDSRGLCPAGWHVPSDGDWKILQEFLGGEKEAGAKMKAISPLWKKPNIGATDESGFSALPGGERSYSDYGSSFMRISETCEFWSSSGREFLGYPVYFVLYGSFRWFMLQAGGKGDGKSIRCIKD